MKFLIIQCLNLRSSSKNPVFGAQCWRAVSLFSASQTRLYRTCHHLLRFSSSSRYFELPYVRQVPLRSFSTGQKFDNQTSTNSSDSNETTLNSNSLKDSQQQEQHRGENTMRKTRLRSATRSVLAFVPGSAYSVMQQDFYAPERLVAKLRSWSAQRRRLKNINPSACSRGRKSDKKRKRVTNISEKKNISRSNNTEAELVSGNLKDDKNLHAKVATEKSSVAAMNNDFKFAKTTVPPPFKSADSVSKSDEKERVIVNNGHSCQEKEERIQSYEGMLQLILPSGSVTDINRTFLSTYRDMIRISKDEHLAALARYGWTPAEFLEGRKFSGPQPKWKILLNNLSEYCERNGTAIIMVGSLTSVCSIVMPNIIYLRLLSFMSASTYLVYHITRQPPLWPPAYWNMIFMCLNGMMIIFLALERRPESFTEEELDVFERFFQSVGLGPRQFKKLLKLASWRSLADNEVLIQQNSQVTQLSLLYKGELSVSVNNQEVEILKEGDKNAVIGVKSFLTKLEYIQQNVVKSNNYFSADQTTTASLKLLIAPENSSTSSFEHSTSPENSSATPSAKPLASLKNPSASVENPSSPSKLPASVENPSTHYKLPASVENTSSPSKSSASVETPSSPSKSSASVENSSSPSPSSASVEFPLTSVEHLSVTAEPHKEKKDETPELINRKMDDKKMKANKKLLSTDLTKAPNNLDIESTEILNEIINNKKNKNSLIIPTSSTTITGKGPCILLVWDIDELLKLVTGDPVNIGFPVVGAFARSLVARARTQSIKQNISSYEAVMTAVLADGELSTQEKRFLRECRIKFNVSKETHWELVNKHGWTHEEFEDGAKRNVLLPTNRGIRSIISGIMEQVRGIDNSQNRKEEEDQIKDIE